MRVLRQYALNTGGSVKKTRAIAYLALVAVAVLIYVATVVACAWAAGSFGWYPTPIDLTTQKGRLLCSVGLAGRHMIHAVPPAVVVQPLCHVGATC